MATGTLPMGTVTFRIQQDRFTPTSGASTINATATVTNGFKFVCWVSARTIGWNAPIAILYPQLSTSEMKVASGGTMSGDILAFSLQYK